VIEKLHKLMIDATGFGYYQADDADPTEAVCEYSKARAREDALLGTLKLTVGHMEYLHGEDAYGGCRCSLDRCDCVLPGDYATVKDCIREIEATR